MCAMPTTLAIISDTHLPRGNRALPRACVERLAAADLIIHAGDLTAAPVLAEIRRFGEVLAVAGNRDDPELTATLPETLELEIESSHIAVIHDSGAARGRTARLQRRFPQADLVIFGHSHIPWHVRDPTSGRQLFNPRQPDRQAPPAAVHHGLGGDRRPGHRARIDRARQLSALRNGRRG